MKETQLNYMMERLMEARALVAHVAKELSEELEQKECGECGQITWLSKTEFRLHLRVEAIEEKLRKTINDFGKLFKDES